MKHAYILLPNKTCIYSFPLFPIKNQILSNGIHFNFYAKMIDFHCLTKKNLQTTAYCLQTILASLKLKVKNLRNNQC
jgi:hypothetical protein